MSFERACFCCLVLCTVLTACNGSDKNPATRDSGAGDSGAPDAGGAVCSTDGDCDDGLYCNGQETCVGQQCQAGTAITCDDGIACTIDACSERTRKCASAPADRDSDGHFDARCKDKTGKVLGDDCDDTDPLRFPGNIETCDPDNKDEDCDPKTFGDKDSDNDGFFDKKCCNPVSDDKGAKLACGSDCDDLKASVNPKAAELCDDFDNDCDGKTDEGVGIKMYRDADFDGHGEKGPKVKAVMKCPGAVGFAGKSNDCNDNDPEVFEGQFEICDGKDNNCDGNIDEVEEEAPWFVDADGDRFGDATSVPVYSCQRIPGRELSHNDCNDKAAAVNPAAAELCDGVDNDCNGKRDFKLDTNDFEDDDNDDVADSNCKGGKGGDCDDTDATTAKGKEEVCDMRDNDCDGKVDEMTATTVWYLDQDGDGWGTNIGSALARCQPIPGRAPNFGDCDDAVNSVHPGALETCNGADDNCNGKTDEGTDYQCPLESAVGICKLGHCSVLSCFPGHDDCNHKAQDGCECTVPIVAFKTGCSGKVSTFCDDGNYCNGKEQCIGDGCFHGTPVNCEASSSVLQGSFLIQSSLDIQMLAGIETITGDLGVSAVGLVNLTGLEALTTIGGNLTVDGDVNDNGSVLTNESLTALVGSGLYNLINVGGTIKIEDNPTLTVIRFPSLVTAGSILIRRNTALTTLDGFESLVKVSNAVDISGNTALTTLPGMQALDRVGSLTLHDNGLTELRLGGLTTIDGNFDPAGVLAARQGNDLSVVKIVMPKLTTIGGNVEIQSMHALTTLSLPALKRVKGMTFSIYGCDVLNDPTVHAFLLGPDPGGPVLDTSLSFSINSDPVLTKVGHIGAVTCATNNCMAQIGYNTLLDNCDAITMLTPFVGFTYRQYYGNVATTCKDGQL